MEGTGWFFKQDQLPQELNSGRVEREVSKQACPSSSTAPRLLEMLAAFAEFRPRPPVWKSTPVL
jgi:hypothetical protein